MTSPPARPVDGRLIRDRAADLLSRLETELRRHSQGNGIETVARADIELIRATIAYTDNPTHHITDPTCPCIRCTLARATRAWIETVEPIIVESERTPAPVSIAPGESVEVDPLRIKEPLK